MRAFRLLTLLLLLVPAGCGRVDGFRAGAALPAGAAGAACRGDGDPRDPRCAGVAGTFRRAHRLCGARAGAARRVHVLTCGFGGTTFERDRLDLVAVETDGGTDRRGAAHLPQALSRARRGARPLATPAPRCGRGSGDSRVRAAAAGQRACARGGLCAARDRLFADLRPGRADQSGVRRDRGARRLRGDRRRRGGGRARDRRSDRGPCAGASGRRRRSRAAGACWSAAPWSRRCTRATGSASRS